MMKVLTLAVAFLVKPAMFDEIMLMLRKNVSVLT